MNDVDHRTSQDPGEELLDLRGLIETFRRRIGLFFAVAALVLLTVVLITLQTTPLYTASSSVMIENRESPGIDFEAVMSGLPPDSAVVDTEVEIIESRSLAEAVVRSLNLTSVPEFNRELEDPGIFGGIVDRAKSFIKGLMPGEIGGDDAFDAEQIAFERVTGRLMEATDARRVGLTFVVNISATSRNPRLARDIANAFADQYLLSQLEAKFTATERANEWLAGRVESLREDVRAKERAVANYRAQEGLLDAEGSSLTEQQISDLNSQLVLQRAELAEAQARLDNVRQQIDRGVSPESIGEVLRSDVIRDLRAQYSAAISRRSELASRYGERHPELVTVNREIADIETQLEQEVARIVMNLENEVNVARNRVGSLSASLGQLRSELVENNSALVRLRELERDAEASRALFESFLGRFRQTDEASTLTDADARIVATASVPVSPSAPNVMLNLALGVVLAGLAGIGAIFLLEMMDNALRTEADVERDLHQPHIASIPRLKAGPLSRFTGRNAPNPARFVVDKPLSSFAEAFRTIRSAIRMAGIDTPLKTVAITSALPGEGKTTTTLGLGRVSAMAQSRVVAVDCDLRRRLLSAVAAPDCTSGLVQVLSGDVSLDDALVGDADTTLDILPLVETSFTPRDLFESEAFAQLLEELKKRYDLVLLDTAPILAVTDTRTIARMADGVVYAALWGKSSTGVARTALHALQSVRANILGVVLNNVDMDAQRHYGYATSGYYYQAYRKYYSE